MSLQNPGKSSIIRKVYKTTFQSLKYNPTLFIPFIIFAIIEFIALMFLYLSPRMPLRLIFGPIVRTFWGEIFLHYPSNFLLLPKLASLSRMFLSVVFSSLLTGVAVNLILDIHNKKKFKIEESFKTAFKKYTYLFTVVLIFTASFYFLAKIITLILIKYFLAGHTRLLFLGPKIWMGPILPCINFIVAIFIQSAFTYAIPALIIDKEKLNKSLIKSFGLFIKFFIPTLILVGVPLVIYIPIIILDYKTAFLINKLFPEIILLVLFLSTIVSSLVIDPLVTLSTAHLYLMNKEK